MRHRWLAPTGLAAVALLAAACGSSSTSSSASTSSPSAAATSSSSAAAAAAVNSAKIGSVSVLTNSNGRTLYWFVPDTSTTSKCNGTCAHYWPPVQGPVTAGSGVAGTFATITRSDGSKQATWNGHPLYTYIGDTAAGEATGNGLNLSGGVWHEVTLTGAAAPAPSPSTGSGGNGY